jgi:hypothetical protein
MRIVLTQNQIKAQNTQICWYYVGNRVYSQPRAAGTGVDGEEILRKRWQLIQKLKPNDPAK